MSERKERKISKILDVYCVLFIILQKIAIHIGAFEYSAAFFLFPLLIVQMGMYRCLALNKKRFLLFLAVMAATMMSNTANVNTMKITSYILFVILYFEVCFDFRISDNNRECLLKTLKTILLISAVIGILQFVMQLLSIPFFDIFSVVPNSIKLSGFNTTYSLSYGSKIMKSNGWFFLEPSFYSQFMALGIISILNEKAFNRKAIVSLVLFGLGLICSFSGTGLLLLVVALLPALKRLRMKNRILMIAGVIIAIFVFSNSKYFYAISDRFFEIRASESSAAIRFLNPYIVAFNMHGTSFFLGNGAGMADSINHLIQVNHNPITKIIVEYGIVTLLAFIPFIFKMFTRNRISVISISVLITYLFLSGSLLQPSILFLLYIFVEIEAKGIRLYRSSQNSSY